MNYILAVLIAKIFFVSLCILQPLDLIAQDNRIDSLKGILKTAKEDTSKVNALNFLADLTTTLDAVKGMKYAQEAFDLSNKLHYTAGIGTAYVVMGSSYLNQGKLDDAIVYLNKGLKILRENGRIRQLYQEAGFMLPAGSVKILNQAESTIDRATPATTSSPAHQPF